MSHEALKKTLTDIATEMRSEMVDTFEDETLTGVCLECSKALVHKLNQQHIESEIVVGFMDVDQALLSDDWEEIFDPLHYWVKVNDYVVDITCTQFMDYMIDDYSIEYLEDVFVNHKDDSPLHVEKAIYSAQ